MDLSDRVALVTGAGRGIGRGIALVMARHGAHVVVADLRREDAATVAAEVQALGRRAVALALDVTDDASIAAAVDEALDRMGRIDVLVNNAGIYAAPGWEERDRFTDEDWDLLYRVNVRGVARVTDAVAPHMKERRYGKVVNIASGAGREGSPDNPPYAISKAGVISLTQAQAKELAPFDVNVNCICPGLLWTPMWEKIAYRRRRLEGREVSPRRYFEELVARTVPLGREQTPEDIGYLAAFLASDYARNITGQAINVNGGSRMN